MQQGEGGRQEGAIRPLELVHRGVELLKDVMVVNAERSTQFQSLAGRGKKKKQGY